MAADQQRLIAFAFGELEVAAVTFEGAFGQVLAAFAVEEAAGVVVVFEVGQGRIERSRGARDKSPRL
ncbi:hypothetical protein J2X66_004848 [Pseudomonas sp. 3296]|nr:hypothetical protein [Pseudomonas sp. 3296]